MIYPKTPVFIGCFEPSPIAAVAEYVEASGDVILGFRWTISSLTKEVIRQMCANSYVAAMWSDVEEPQQSARPFRTGDPALKCSPAQWFRVVAKRQPSSVSHGAGLSHAMTNENLSAMTSDMGKVLKPDAGRTFVAFVQAYVQPQ
jgi:hypothetical protein